MYSNIYIYTYTYHVQYIYIINMAMWLDFLPQIMKRSFHPGCVWPSTWEDQGNSLPEGTAGENPRGLELNM